ncbi:alpha-(1,6)-fucosyltransferase-like [Pomacea canaliculata]|uniref:alpha-(1,6)-fucosyltransferase-like n=1 Tax=Pomacea canaliculata TaxID=400727 RepID=UPI000D734082|nr:alpha-(1,6)-fucosyltransferase-like [Pomacea canaliculata]
MAFLTSSVCKQKYGCLPMTPAMITKRKLFVAAIVITMVVIVVMTTCTIEWIPKKLWPTGDMSTDPFTLVLASGNIEISLSELMERCLQQGETTLSEGLHRARHCLKEAAGEITVIKLGRLLNYSDPGENQTKALYPLSTERETARRRVESTAREVFYFITAKMDALRSGYFSVNESTEPFIDSTKRELEDYKLALSSDLHRLRHVDKDEEWRDSESRRLGELVQRRLHDLQVRNLYSRQVEVLHSCT